MKIISADYVLTMNSNLDCIKDGAILIDGALIKQVGTLQELTQQYPEAAVTQYPKSLLMPGLINTHCHSGLLRGTAEGLPVWNWLQQFIDPMHRVVTPEDSKIASYLCYAEALLSGTTTIVDMWRYMEGSAEAAQQLGIRAVLVPYVAEHPDHNYFETLNSNEALIQNGIKPQMGEFRSGLAWNICFMLKKRPWHVSRKCVMNIRLAFTRIAMKASLMSKKTYDVMACARSRRWSKWVCWMGLNAC